MKNILKLNLTKSKISDLSGLIQMPKLECLELRILSKINNLYFFKEQFFLKKIFIEDCKGIEIIDGLENLPNLEEIIILNCKTLPSCNFLNNACAKLTKVTIKGTKVLDNSEGIIMRFKEYYFGNDSAKLSHLIN